MRLKALVIDLDGSVYHGTKLIEGAAEALNHLTERYAVLFLTNNSTRSRAEYVQRLTQFGISVVKEQLITSGYAAVRYVQANYPQTRFFVLGSPGLKEELREHQITLCDDACDGVLVGLDKEFTYAKLQQALTLLLHGAVFIATNTDPYLLTSEGIKPGAGSLVAALETASGRKAIVTGKPSAFITALIQEQLQLPAREILVVGDNLQTDILMGHAGGMRTALVLTGASKREDIERLLIQPDYVLPSITELPQLLASL
jgi:HAD superfamily hydrolase (TIGR01457 family)